MPNPPPAEPEVSPRFLERILFPRCSPDPAALRRALCGKTILVTGASFGIGEALVELLAPTGATLLLVARTADKLQAVRARAQSLGADARAMAADLRSDSDMSSVLSWLDGQPDGVDIVVHNAGKSIHRSLFDSRERFHDFQRTMAINYLAPVRLTLHLLPRLRERRGQILNVSAANVLLPPVGGWAAYQASKCAFDQWIGCARQELEQAGVRVSTAYFPLVRTRMIEPTFAYARLPAMEVSQAAARLAMLLGRGRGDWSPWWFPLAAKLAHALPRRIWRLQG